MRNYVAAYSKDLDQEFKDRAEANRNLVASDMPPPHGGVAAVLASSSALVIVIALLVVASVIAFAVLRRSLRGGHSPRKVLYTSARNDYAQLPGALRLLRDLLRPDSRHAQATTSPACSYSLLESGEEGGLSPARQRDAAE